jgi:hypothetical protein
MMALFRYAALPILFGLGASASGSEHSPLSVVNVALGANPTPSNKIGVPRSHFRPDETIYLSVETDGKCGSISSGIIGVNWTYGIASDPEEVHSDAHEVLACGRQNTLFQIEKPDDWPIGTYHAEVFIDGESFTVVDYKVP